MISVTQIRPNVLEVVSSIYSFTKSTKQYWYYDLNSRLKSQHGKQGDAIDKHMSAVEYEWAVKYYLPKVS